MFSQTFTPPRVGLVSWAFAALIMGTVGLASYQFGGRTALQGVSGTGSGGLFLPPAGDIESTASIPHSGTVPIGIMQMPEDDADLKVARYNQEKIEVLQRELVGLRRRLGALTEQNTAYAKRIAALELQIASSEQTSRTPPTVVTPHISTALEPAPGVVSGAASSEAKIAQTNGKATAPKAKRSLKTTAQVTVPPPNPERMGSRAPAKGSNNVPARIVSMNNDEQRARDATALTDPAKTSEPVRIVTLPRDSQPPEATASIPPQSPEARPRMVDTSPTLTTAKPAIVTPSTPAGRLKGGGENKLRRSDFGAVIGRYTTSADATRAWGAFKEQNEERIRDLRPLILKREVAEGGVSLLVGPFANAADAAVACLQMLDVTEFCQPALYAGEPLVTAADFPDSAF
ncbi:hypothetical protein FMN50_09605 [Rhodobacterales bacterium]|nr:hypothetical protein FMN50_09605 [Rhodobacterales bacterium]